MYDETKYWRSTFEESKSRQKQDAARPAMQKNLIVVCLKATSLMQELSLKCLIIQTFEFEVPDYSDESREQGLRYNT